MLQWWLSLFEPFYRGELVKNGEKAVWLVLAGAQASAIWRFTWYNELPNIEGTTSQNPTNKEAHMGAHAWLVKS
jgi:hypothetical protein